MTTTRTNALADRAHAIAMMREAERLLGILGERRAPTSEGAARLALHEGALHDSWSGATAAYIAALPRYTISRCPFSGAPLELAIDTVGLDGPWWRYEAPLRAESALPPTFLGLAGAMQLHAPVESTPYLVVPGPGVPWILPRVMEATDVVAVVSTIPVGAHTGYGIAYFTAGEPRVDPPRTWATNTTLLPGGQWSDADDDEDTFDYDLARWIAAGRVRWIAPGDAAMSLREGVAGCPYLDLPGPRRMQHAQDGVVW